MRVGIFFHCFRSAKRDRRNAAGFLMTAAGSCGPESRLERTPRNTEEEEAAFPDATIVVVQSSRMRRRGMRKRRIRRRRRVNWSTGENEKSVIWHTAPLDHNNAWTPTLNNVTGEINADG